jgi:predicted phosphoribosyltransferase
LVRSQLAPSRGGVTACCLNKMATAVVDSARASEQTDIVEKLTLPVLAENQLGVVRSDQDLHQALRDRANQLNIARETIDEIAGLTPGHASKLLAPQQIKRFGPHPPEG